MHARGGLAALLVLTGCWAGAACAWGPQGHRTVGAIADRLLSSDAQRTVAELLADDLDKFGNLSGRTTLESISVWADEVSGTSAAHPKWHYDDIPVCGSAPKSSYCPEGECNSEQLKRLIGVLGDARAPHRERNEALKWIVHLIGDIHQPLHAADNADHGGNKVAVVLEGVHTRGRENLHRAWDGDFVSLALHSRNRQQPPPDIDQLALEAKRLVGEAGQGTPDSWASESNNLARNVVYQYRGFACGSIPTEIVVLDRDYQAEALPVVRDRLLYAGGRLANLLNHLFGAQERIPAAFGLPSP